jgi:hypothetical protein
MDYLDRSAHTRIMGWQIKRRVKTSDNSWANVSKSGVGASRKVGPRTTINSKGRGVHARRQGADVAREAVLT